LPTNAELLLDTSAAIALALPSAELHTAVTERTRGATLGLAGHAQFETYSVLTRLPGALRLDAAAARLLIVTNFPASVFLAPPAVTRALATLAGQEPAAVEELRAAAQYQLAVHSPGLSGSTAQEIVNTL
jgi:hypothetical protein